MSQLENTSAILGEYMLKGWTLTDLHCDRCRVTPLMREPNAIAERENRDRIQFCALCDGRPEGRPTTSQAPAQAPSPTTNTIIPSSSSSRNQPTQSRQEEGGSTNQADEAALSISELLLKGYSLLGDNCPNSLCKGIPLVGYPKKSNGSKDSRRLCVSCGSRWIDEGSIEQEGMKVINPSSSRIGASLKSQPPAEEVVEGEAESPRSKARRELYGLDVKGKNKQTTNKHTLDKGKFEKFAEESARKLQGGNDTVEDVDMDDEDLREDNAEFSHHEPALKTSASIPPVPLPRPLHVTFPPSPNSGVGKALASTSDSLSSTLQNLSSSLEKYASHPPAQSQRRNSGLGGEEDSGKWFVDLKLHTEAIKDVLGVLGQVERARRVGY